MQRVLLIVLGWLCVALAVVGVALPLLPTTPFLLVAAWAFARSSPRFQTWLETHEIFGPYIVNWHRFGVVPLRAKLLALAMMSASFIWLAIWSTAGTGVVAGVGCVLAGVAVFLLTRPSTPPTKTERI